MKRKKHVAGIDRVPNTAVVWLVCVQGRTMRRGAPRCQKREHICMRPWCIDRGLPLPANTLRMAKALAAFPVSPILIAVIITVVADDSLSQHQMKCTVPYIYILLNTAIRLRSASNVIAFRTNIDDDKSSFGNDVCVCVCLLRFRNLFRSFEKSSATN
jgi:hypothetical protein